MSKSNSKLELLLPFFVGHDITRQVIPYCKGNFCTQELVHFVHNDLVHLQLLYTITWYIYNFSRHYDLKNANNDTFSESKPWGLIKLWNVKYIVHDFNQKYMHMLIKIQSLFFSHQTLKFLFLSGQNCIWMTG